MKRVLCFIAIGLMSVGMASAQTGWVYGTVVDGEGLPVEGARVSLRAEGICMAYVETNGDGEYEFIDVEVGLYTVRAGLQHVGNAVSEEFEVLEGEGTEVPELVLECGGGQGGNQHQRKFQHQQQHQGGGE